MMSMTSVFKNSKTYIYIYKKPDGSQFGTKTKNRKPLFTNNESTNCMYLQQYHWTIRKDLDHAPLQMDDFEEYKKDEYENTQ